MEDPLIEKADSSSEPSKAETRPDEEVQKEGIGFFRCLERIFLPRVEPDNAEVDKSESSNKFLVISQILSVIALLLWLSIDASGEEFVSDMSLVHLMAVVSLQIIRFGNLYQNKALLFAAVAAPVVAAFPLLLLLLQFSVYLLNGPSETPGSDEIVILIQILATIVLWAIVANRMNQQMHVWSDAHHSVEGTLSWKVMGLTVGVPAIACIVCNPEGDNELATLLATWGGIWGTVAFGMIYYFKIRTNEKYFAKIRASDKATLFSETAYNCDLLSKVQKLAAESKLKIDEESGLLDPEEFPEGIEPCFYIRGPRHVCLPYDDKHMVASQVLSIFATLLSWVWWLDLIVSIAATILFQILWCYRMNTTWMLTCVVAASFASLVSGIAWLVFSVCWLTNVDREVFTLEYRGHWSNIDHFVWATLSFVCALLWAGSAYCMLHFVTSGKHAKLEKYHINKYLKENPPDASKTHRKRDVEFSQS